MPDSITIQASYLLLAIALLWFPRSWLRNGKRILKKRRKPDDALERLAGIGANDPENKSVQLGREFKNFRNYLDLFRALAGAYSLSHYSFTAGSGTEMLVAGMQGVILLVAVLIQSIRYDKRLSFYAPIFFFVGMATGYVGDYTCLFAFALVMAVNPVIPNPRWFLTCLGLFALPLGYVFGADMGEVGVTSAGILLPPLLSLLTKRPLVVFTRKSKSRSRSA